MQPLRCLYCTSDQISIGVCLSCRSRLDNQDRDIARLKNYKVYLEKKNYSLMCELRSLKKTILFQSKPTKKKRKKKRKKKQKSAPKRS